MTPSAAGSLSNAPTKPVCSESPGPVRREPDHFYGTFPQRRRPSKSYGDLSNIRPRSPPSYGPHSQHKGLRLSPGKYIEDTPLDFYTDVVSSVQTEQMQIGPSATFVGGKAEVGPLVPPVRARLLCSVEANYVQHLEPLDNELALPSKIHRDLPHFRIEGLPRIAWTGVKDVYLPVIQPYISAFERDSPAMRSLAFVHDAEPVEHIDMCTIWRGLTSIEAHNLFRIHQVFERTISYLVSGQLTDPQWESLAVSRISDAEKANSMPVNHCQRLQLDPQKLASDIASTLASQGRLVGDSAQFPLDRLIDLYLAKSDCLIVNKPDDPHYGAIDVLIKSYKPEAASPSATPLIEAGWYPEYLAFTGLDFRPHEGQELTIIPHYCSNSFSGTLGCHVETRFYLEAPVSWLEWDGRISGWKGIVPVFSEVRDGEDDSIFGKVYRAGRVGPYAIINLLRVEVKAVRIERLGSLCIERTLRARLTIKVLPFWSKGFTPSPQIIPMQSTKGQRVASATQRRFSRVISGCSLLESVLEPSIYVSPKPAIPSERLEVHRKDQRSPSHRFCATQLLASDQSVMRKVRKMNSLDSQDFASTEDSHTKAPAAQQALERSGPPNPRPNPQTDLEAYASSVKLALYGNGTHISGRSVNRQRFSSKCSAKYISYRHPEHLHNKPSQVWRNLLKDFRESMASIKKAHPSKDVFIPASFASASVPMEAVEHAVADGSLRRDITLGSEAHTENQLVFREEIIIHPASAEIFALAESLHKRPSSQEQSPRKRSRGVSFEDSPVKKTREHVDDDEPIGNDPLENTMDDGDVVPATPSCMDQDSSSHSSVSPTISRNPDELPGSRKDSMFGTDTDTEFEDSQESAVSSTHEMDFDSYDDPKLQKEQALLWDILCKKRADGGKDEKLSAEERKQLFEATKQSWATEESRQSARLGINFSEAFTASSEGLEQSDSENERVSEDSSCFESNPGSDTIHVNVLLDDGMAGPKLTLQKPTDEESEPESGHAEPRTKVRIEDHTTESSLSERNSSDSDEQTESDDDFLASLYRPGTPSPAAGRQTAVRSLRNALSSPSQADRVERSPREVALEKAITLGKALNERGRTRDRMPLMGLFGSGNRVRDGSTPTRVGGLRKRCSGFGCEEDKENV